MHLPKHPLVSIIMPAYNGADTIKRAILSAMQQNYPNIEIIVVDDDSTDKTRDVLNSLTDKDMKLHLLQNSINQGIAKTLNRGLANASGTYIANLDQDDYRIDTYKIQKQVSFLQEHPEISILGTNGIIKNNKEGYYYSHVPEIDEKIRKGMLGTCPFMHSSVMYKKEIHERIGGYPTDVKYCPDFAYWLKAGSIAKFANLPDYTFLYDTNAQNTCYSHYLKQTKEALILLMRYRKEYPHMLRGIKNIAWASANTCLSKHFPSMRKQLRKAFSKPDTIPLDTPRESILEKISDKNIDNVYNQNTAAPLYQGEFSPKQVMEPEVMEVE